MTDRNRHAFNPVFIFYLCKDLVLLYKQDPDILKKLGLAVKTIINKHPERFKNAPHPRIRGFLQGKKTDNSCLIIENDDMLEVYPSIVILEKWDISLIEVQENKDLFHKPLHNIEAKNSNILLLQKALIGKVFSGSASYSFALPEIRRPLLESTTKLETKLKEDSIGQETRLASVTNSLGSASTDLSTAANNITDEEKNSTEDSRSAWQQIRTQISPLQVRLHTISAKCNDLSLKLESASEKIGKIVTDNNLMREAFNKKLHAAALILIEAIQSAVLTDYVSMLKHYEKLNLRVPYDKVDEFNHRYGQVAGINGENQLCFFSSLCDKSVKDLRIIISNIFLALRPPTKTLSSLLNYKNSNYLSTESLEILNTYLQTCGTFNNNFFTFTPKLIPEPIQLLSTTEIEEEAAALKEEITRAEQDAQAVIDDIDILALESKISALQAVTAEQKKRIYDNIVSVNNKFSNDGKVTKVFFAAEELSTTSFARIKAANKISAELGLASSIRESIEPSLKDNLCEIRKTYDVLSKLNTDISISNEVSLNNKLKKEFKVNSKKLTNLFESMVKIYEEIETLSKIPEKALQEKREAEAKVQQQKELQAKQLAEEKNRREQEKAAEEKRIADAELKNVNDAILIASVKKYKILLSDIGFWNKIRRWGGGETVKGIKIEKGVKVKQELKVQKGISELYHASQGMTNTLTADEARVFCQKFAACLTRAEGRSRTKFFGLFLIRDPKVDQMYDLGRQLVRSLNTNHFHLITDEEAASINPEWKSAPAAKKSAPSTPQSVKNSAPNTPSSIRKTAANTPPLINNSAPNTPPSETRLSQAKCSLHKTWVSSENSPDSSLELQASGRIASPEP